MKKAILCLAVLFAAACTDVEGSAKALHSLGIKQVTFTGYAWTGCGRDDTYATGFTGFNAQGDAVSGVVCCGYWKNCTVRF